MIKWLIKLKQEVVMKKEHAIPLKVFVLIRLQSWSCGPLILTRVSFQSELAGQPGSAGRPGQPFCEQIIDSVYMQIHVMRSRPRLTRVEQGDFVM